MKCTIQNLARRPVSLHCNSGKTFHLPPGYVMEIPAEEVKGNKMAEKLASRKLLSVKSEKSSGAAKATSPSPKGSSSPKGKKAK